MNDCCTVSELRDKAVINVCDGRKLGYPCDFGFDACENKLISLIIPAECGLFTLNRPPDRVIPWHKITRIGRDAILVDLPPEAPPDACSDADCPCEPKKKRRWFF